MKLAPAVWSRAVEIPREEGMEEHVGSKEGRSTVSLYAKALGDPMTAYLEVVEEALAGGLGSSHSGDALTLRKDRCSQSGGGDLSPGGACRRRM